MSNPDKKSNERYRQLEEIQGAELNVCAQTTSSCHTSFENGTERSMELSSVVVIPDEKDLPNFNVCNDEENLSCINISYRMR